MIDRIVIAIDPVIPTITVQTLKTAGEHLSAGKWGAPGAAMMLDFHRRNGDIMKALPMMTASSGEVPERLNGAVSKTVDGFAIPGFESLPLRHYFSRICIREWNISIPGSNALFV